jgi:ATP-dependent Clp protease ATP-binding subunit ClpA
MEQIVDKFVDQLRVQLAAKNVTVALTDKARAWLAKQGYDEVFGARPLVRLIQRKVRQPLAEQMLFGALEQGGSVTIDEGQEGLVFVYSA